MENGQERRTWIDMDINTVGWMGHKIQFFFSCLLLQINSNFIKLSHLITLLFFGFWLSCLRWFFNIFWSLKCFVSI